MTDREKFEEYRKELIEYDRETVHFLSNQQKPERERSVCAAFLRCLGVNFSIAELVPGADPPDVRFREACFEVRDILDEGRKPHGEAKAWVERDEQAQTIEDVFYHHGDRALLMHTLKSSAMSPKDLQRRLLGTEWLVVQSSTPSYMYVFKTWISISILFSQAILPFSIRVGARFHLSCLPTAM